VGHYQSGRRMNARKLVRSVNYQKEFESDQLPCDLRLQLI